MRPEERDPAYLWDILQASREVEDMLVEHDLPAFMENRVLIRAIERNMEIIGEAARRVSMEFKAQHPEIPWRQVIGQRNILAHEYGQIDHELLYKTAAEDVPELSQMIRSLLPPEAG